ncbi:ATP-binding protein [Pseudonocardia sp.]|uniref:ATP-binding protein n=1 Tax=Pseudonocardia sp. TaxID=60912 RepID=UPI003D0AB4C0
MLRVRLLGGVAAERDGAGLELTATARRLLAFLALHPGPQERDALALRFWPDAPAGGGRANLRTAVWALRRDLGPDAVVTTRTTVGLCPSAYAVDVEDAVERAERGDPEAVTRLCRAELLAGVPDDWARAAREEHRARVAGLLDRIADRAEAAGDAPAAARWSRERCALTPLDEPAHGILLRRLAVAGDRAGAVAVGRELAERLRAELGVAPGAAVQGALAAAHRPERPAGRAWVQPWPLYGRGPELRELAAAWTAARGGRGGVVVVTGEAGIGKTRLVRELALRADNAGARVAAGAGVDVGGETPLAMWQELASELVAVVPAPPGRAGWPAELGRLAPDLAAALGRDGVPAPVAAPELERLRIFDAVLRLVEWASADRPVLLVAEDVHRADRVSMQLCAHIGRRVNALPVLVVLTRRDRPARPEADALLADLAGRGVAVAEIDVGPLTAAELAAVVRSVAPVAEPDLARVIAMADGNPLLAVEAARTLPGGAGPSGLRSVVRAATGSLPPVARELIESVAAAGRELGPAEIDRLVPGDRSGTERQVLETGLVDRVRGGLRFRHALLAEAARADLRDPEGCHERVALAVESAAGPAGADRVAAEVAAHLHRAGRDDLAGERYARAARHARSIGALVEAEQFAEEAVRCRPDDVDARLDRAEILALRGQQDGYEREWREAHDRMPAADRALAWVRRGVVLRTIICHPTASLAAYRTAWDQLPEHAEDLRAQVLVGMAWGEAAAGDPARSRRLLAELAALQPTPSPLTTADMESARLMTLVRLGRFTECEPVAHRAWGAAEAAGRIELAYAIWVHTAAALACAGDLDGALRAADRAVAATTPVPVVGLPCLAARAHVLSRLGRHDEAVAAAQEQLALAERMDSAAFVALARHDAGLVALAAGRHRSAADLLGAALDSAAAVSRPATRLARAEALACAGAADEADAEIRRAVLEPVGPGDQPWALVPRMTRIQGLVARSRGDLPLARRRLTEAADAWRRHRGDDAGEDFMANFVDFGRPPIVGLIEPGRELARIATELAGLTGPGDRPQGVR